MTHPRGTTRFGSSHAAHFVAPATPRDRPSISTEAETVLALLDGLMLVCCASPNDPTSESVPARKSPARGPRGLE